MAVKVDRPDHLAAVLAVLATVEWMSVELLGVITGLDDDTLERTLDGADEQGWLVRPGRRSETARVGLTPAGREAFAAVSSALETAGRVNG